LEADEGVVGFNGSERGGRAKDYVALGAAGVFGMAEWARVFFGDARAVAMAGEAVDGFALGDGVRDCRGGAVVRATLAACGEGLGALGGFVGGWGIADKCEGGEGVFVHGPVRPASDVAEVGGSGRWRRARAG
jgi:hypothetical protein